ncbi:MAG: nickel-dependent hydrogenase large subunit [Proteobacteria bacterium]|nr:nickel-dependent hydrogenase large subunit [Pseudomonadota bacterium]MBU1582736.1 nickel-dependent hydrogenase large subunit [Pseudomonadota bacterium]MBU2451846.1 nickel-dependent hydrogenase large subunit [Pseudomonadota bacterium]MBU2631861.1 nickel-dependent hydrogenase large subunit [Pseudomonadota bacterium]
MNKSKTIEIDPVTRVEGDLRFQARCDDQGVISHAQSSGSMFRGFERFLVGKNPIDALGITPRICGMCSAAQSYVCSNALRDLFQIQMPANGYHIKNVVLGVENIQNHFTHFYLLFAPDLAHPRYEKKSTYNKVARRFKINGDSYKRFIHLRNDFMNLMGIFGGRWPHNLAMQPGGTSEILNDRLRLNYGYSHYLAFKEGIEKLFLGCTIKQWLKIDTLEKLETYLENQKNKSDLSLFLTAGMEFGLDKLGKGPEKYISAGAYDLTDGSFLFTPGFYDGGFKNFYHQHITESVKYSFFEDDAASSYHPFQGKTQPCYVENKEKYSWVKAPRYQDQVVEVGPLARMILDQDPLVYKLFKQKGASVWLRVFARFQEAVRTVAELEKWILSIQINEPNINHWKDVISGEGVGLGSAARGILGHWIQVEKGVISNYQVITPTAINGSPMDHNHLPGPMEMATIGTNIQDENDPLELLHIIRSYDPCIVCSCHVVRLK